MPYDQPDYFSAKAQRQLSPSEPAEDGENVDRNGRYIHTRDALCEATAINPNRRKSHEEVMKEQYAEQNHAQASRAIGRNGASPARDINGGSPLARLPGLVNDAAQTYIRLRALSERFVGPQPENAISKDKAGVSYGPGLIGEVANITDQLAELLYLMNGAITTIERELP